MTFLLDANVLIALTQRDHVHHDAAHQWFGATGAEPFASCPVTQGSLVRHQLRRGASQSDARDTLAAAARHPRHEFWPDDVSYLDIRLDGVIGHRQVTDAYLAGLARHHSGRLATFDKGLAALHPDVVVAVPTS